MTVEYSSAIFEMEDHLHQSCDKVDFGCAYSRSWVSPMPTAQATRGADVREAGVSRQLRGEYNGVLYRDTVPFNVECGAGARPQASEHTVFRGECRRATG